MSLVGVIGVLAGLLSGIAVDAQVGASSELRVRSLTETGAERQTKASAVAIPSATGILDFAGLRATAAYAPRLWKDDLVGDLEILANHVVVATLATRSDAPWRAEATASGTRGTVDPFSDPLRMSSGSQPTQYTSIHPVSYEELLTAARCELPTGERTILYGSAAWEVIRPLEGADRAIVPEQARASASAAIARLVTELDTLRLDVSGRRVTTLAAEGVRTADVVAGGLNWRRILSLRHQAWVGAGATLARSGDRADPGSWRRLPNGEVGWALGSEGGMLAGHLVARVTTFVDRFNSDVEEMAEGSATLTWRFHESLLVSSGGSVGHRLDGETTLSGADLRLAWSISPVLILEGGLFVRSQRDRSPARPNFTEQTMLVVLAYNSQRLLRTALP